MVNVKFNAVGRSHTPVRRIIGTHIQRMHASAPEADVVRSSSPSTTIVGVPADDDDPPQPAGRSISGQQVATMWAGRQATRRSVLERTLFLQTQTVGKKPSALEGVLSPPERTPPPLLWVAAAASVKARQSEEDGPHVRRLLAERERERGPPQAAAGGIRW